MGTRTDWTDLGRMDELSRLNTPLHRIDARAKLITTLAFLVAVMSLPRHEISALIPFFLFPVILLSLGQIPLKPVLRLIALASPFAIVIGIFNPLLDREPLIALGPVVLSGGWISFFSILLRFLLTVSAALALVALTGIFNLGAGMERLGVPKIFINQLFFLYRYLFVVVDEGATMVKAVHIRSPGIQTLPVSIYSALTGSLLLRSIDRAERIHCAMISRGYDGSIRNGPAPALHARDFAFMGGWITFFIVARLWNLAAFAGALTS